jgi:DNA-binding transcriptional MerR regulator
MSSNKTLHELCDELRVTRRVIQGYEKAGLVSATGRNKYGHLLYNEKAQERIVQIRMYQQLGFTIREIKELIDAPDSFVKAAVEKQILYLKEKKKNIDIWIKEAYGIIKAIEDKEKQ